jgi:hypothetical protein
LGRIIAASLAALSVAAVLGIAAPAVAAGNLAAGGDEIELKIDTTDLKFSQNEFDLETGKYYRMAITADDGADNTALMMPELWRNSWIDQIVINDLEVKTQAPYSLEFDAGGTINVSFVPIRPGEYDFWVAGYEKRGLKGKFVVK